MKMDDEKKSKTVKKLASSVIAVVILSICLCITTFALVYSTVSVENNLFHTGTVKLNLNNGNPVIEEHEFLFEPGMTVEKEFFIENQSSWDVYYKLYFQDIEGGLADVLEVEIRDNDRTLFQGKVSDLTKEKVGAADDILKLNERRNLTVSFHFPEEAGNAAQRLYLTFTMSADAVQTKNNPNKLFD